MAFDFITAGIEFVGKVLDRAIEDPKLKAETKLKFAEMQQTGELAQLTADTELAKAQLAINQTEAQNPSIFVSGWRSFIGWVCGAAFAYHYIIQPLLAFVLASFGHSVALPVFNMDAMLTVLLGMLGLGGMRSFEKIKGVTK